jgi:hypothetical protein
MAGAARRAADVERGAVGVEAAAGAKIDFIEDALGIFPFGLAVCFKCEGRGRGNGGASGRIECVPKTIADGGGGVLKSPNLCSGENSLKKLLFIIQNRFKADAKPARPFKTKGNPPWKILSTSEVPLKRSRCSPEHLVRPGPGLQRRNG